jgi:hypothetical protein
MLFELIEYGIHRLLHMPGVRTRFSYHRIHHQTHYRDHDYKGIPLFKSILQLAIAIGIFCYARLVLGPFALYVSWAILVYNTTHFVSHTNIWPTVRVYHRAHHRDPFKNIGVSSPLLDWLFNTMDETFVVHYPVLLFLLPAPLSFAAITHEPFMN